MNGNDIDSPSVDQSGVDQLIDYANQQIDLLAFDDPAPQLLRQMVRSLGDPRRKTRLELIGTLSQIGEAATPFLLEGLAEQSEAVVRRACCNALTNIGDVTAVPGLTSALLNDPDLSVKSAAAGALAKIGSPAFSALQAVLRSQTASESCKGHAAWAIASMSREIGEALYAMFDDPSATVRLAALGAISNLAQPRKPDALSAPPAVALPPAALSILIAALSDRAADVRIEAMANLARLDCQTAYQPIAACLQDPMAPVRKAAILALAKLADPAAIEAIAPLKADADADVRRVATAISQQLLASS